MALGQDRQAIAGWRDDVLYGDPGIRRMLLLYSIELGQEKRAIAEWRDDVVYEDGDPSRVSVNRLRAILKLQASAAQMYAYIDRQLSHVPQAPSTRRNVGNEGSAPHISSRPDPRHNAEIASL